MRWIDLLYRSSGRAIFSSHDVASSNQTPVKRPCDGCFMEQNSLQQQGVRELSKRLHSNTLALIMSTENLAENAAEKPEEIALFGFRTLPTI